MEADFQAVTGAAGPGPAAPPRSFVVPGCPAPWESYETVGDAGSAALLNGLNGRERQLEERRKRTPDVAFSLTKGTWQLAVVYERTPGARGHLTLLATNGSPACEEAFGQAQTAGTRSAQNRTS
ncbi:hypothetical protein [Streptomyces sp. NPDC054838]